ncbi:choline dehydrogenase 6 [Tritrichomonas musculus]|uniref:Choline dehydrogenase 6 n=1 Tax=Tritrichomonas musculus TaxID=1915356 RepID=A0ABR2KFN1_9EUKA
MSSKKKSSSSEQKENSTDVPLSPYESILACRSNPPGPPQYLVKLREKSYHDSQWISGDELQKNPQSSSMLTRFIKNQRDYPTEEPYYDLQYNIIDRIILKKDRKYFVKWMGLGYEQATWEPKSAVTEEALEDFKRRQLQSHPLKSGDVNKLPSINIQRIVSYPFGDKNLESYQISTMNLLLNNFSKMKNTDIIDCYNSQLTISCAAFFDYILKNPKENNNNSNTRSTRRTRSQKNDDNDSSEGENEGECGPVLIVAPLTSTVKWYDAFRQIKNATTLNYTGKKEGRQVSVDKDFYYSEDRLKFHVLITTPDILAHDMELLSEIKWRIGIFDEANRLRNPKSKLTQVLQHFVIGTQIAFMQNAPNYFALKKLTDLLIASSTNPYINEDIKKAADKVRSQIQPKVLKRKNTNNEEETFSTYYIDCPLSSTQKKILRKVIHEAARYIQKKNFIPLCQRILRICSHPFLLHSQEYMLSGVDLIESSTKLSILKELLIKKETPASIPVMSTTNRVLIMSDFSLMLDMIEDVFRKNSIKTERIILASKEIQHEDATVFLYNPKYCRISPSLFESMNMIIVFDGDGSELEEMLKMKKPPHLHKIYRFQCRDCSEERLSQMCIINNVNIDEIKPGQYESICKLSALAALSDKKAPDPRHILEKATVVKNTFNQNEVIEQDFENCDFWSYLVGDEDPVKEQGEFESENILANNAELESTNHEWTCRERDQLLRGLCRFGFNRWKEMRIQTGLRISVKNVVNASRALVREMIRILRSDSGHAVTREFIKETTLEDDEVSDKEFINKSCFSESDFKSNLSKNVVLYLREIENIHFLGESAKDKSVYEISLPHPSGTLPKWWKEDYDRYLVYGTWKYGLGCYEQFVEDANQDIQKIFGPSDDPIDQKDLTERVMKLADAIKRKQSINQRGESTEKTQSKKDNAAYQPPPSISSAQEAQGSQSDSEFSSNPNSGSSTPSYTISSRSRKVEPTASYDNGTYGSESTSRWSREEKRDIYQFLNRYGVPEDSLGNPDYEAFARDSHLNRTRTVDEVKVMVEEYLSKCQIPQEEGGNKQNTSRKINQRCTSMRQLREILRDEEKAPYIFEHAPHWRYLPKEWTYQHEYQYFREILNIGLVNDAYQEILKGSAFDDIFKEKPPPSFMFKDTLVMKRIKNIYSSMIEGMKDGSLEKLMKSSPNSNLKISKPASHIAKPITQVKPTPNLSENTALNAPKKSKIKMPAPEGYTIQSNRSLFPADRAIFDGRVILPLNLGGDKIILETGKIVPEHEEFHNDRYIYPIGYKISNILPSSTEKGINVNWINEIALDDVPEEAEQNSAEQEEDGEKSSTASTRKPKLIFRSWMENRPDKVYEGDTPNAVWGKICDDINAVNNDGKKVVISGIDAFLLSNPNVTYLIQKMKGAKKCNKYKVKPLSLPPEAQRMRQWNQYLGIPFENLKITPQAIEAKSGQKNSKSKKETVEENTDADEQEEEEEEVEEEEEEEEVQEEEEEPSYDPKAKSSKSKSKTANNNKKQSNKNNTAPQVNNKSNANNTNKKQNQVRPNIKSNGGINNNPIVPPNGMPPSMLPGAVLPKQLKQQFPGQFLPQGNMMQNYFNQGNLMAKQAMQNQLMNPNLMQPNMIQNNSSPPNLPFFIPNNMPNPQMVQNNLPQGYMPQPGFMQSNQMQNFYSKPNVINNNNNNNLIQNNNPNPPIDQVQMQTQMQQQPPIQQPPPQQMQPQQPDVNIQSTLQTDPTFANNNNPVNK